MVDKLHMPQRDFTYYVIVAQKGEIETEISDKVQVLTDIKPGIYGFMSKEKALRFKNVLNSGIEPEIAFAI